MDEKCGNCKHYSHDDFYDCYHEKMDYGEFHNSLYGDVVGEKTRAIFNKGNNFAIYIDIETCRSFPVGRICINPEFCCKYFEVKEVSHER